MPPPPSPERLRRRACAIRAVVSAAVSKAALLAANGDPLDDQSGDLLVAAEILADDLVADLDHLPTEDNR